EGESKNGFKDKSSSKQLYFRTQEVKERVVEFLQTSNSFELQMISGVSGKKIEIIENMRPFHDWSDAVMKFTERNLSTDILDKCCEVVRAQEVVKRLMDSCENMAKDLGKTVEQLKALEQPKMLNSEMKLSHYQMIGLNWLALMYKKGINCILADEMGLGKTIQVIAFFAYLRERKAVRGPHLVIVPASTLENWSREFQTWCPDINILLYYGHQDERAMIREQISKNEIDFDVIITSYTIAQSPGDRSLFKKSRFKYCVFDEAHYLKNIKSTRYTALMNLKAKHRLLLTGTPLQNNLVELMSLLIFTMPHMFSGKTDQIKTLFTYTNKESTHRITYISERIEQAKKIMKPFVLRRLKSEVLQELPPKIDNVLNVPMSSEQELKYADLIENYTREIKYKKITFEDNESEEKFKSGNSMLMDLRKVANHPLLIRQHYDDNKLRLIVLVVVIAAIAVDTRLIRIVKLREILLRKLLFIIFNGIKTLRFHHFLVVFEDVFALIGFPFAVIIETFHLLVVRTDVGLTLHAIGLSLDAILVGFGTVVEIPQLDGRVKHRPIALDERVLYFADIDLREQLLQLFDRVFAHLLESHSSDFVVQRCLRLFASGVLVRAVTQHSLHPTLWRIDGRVVRLARVVGLSLADQFR
ncbi:unnamed protein product, partial [Oppiella nova]